MQAPEPRHRNASRLSFWLLLSVFLLAMPIGTHAQPADDPPKRAASMGPLANTLLYGQEDQGPWQGQTDGNGYRLINPADANAITYFYLNAPPQDPGPRSVEVKTALIQGDGSTGLIYGFTDQPKQYFLYLIDRQGQLRILHRQPEGGFNELFSARLQADREDAQPAPQPAGPRLVTLRLVEDAGSVTAFLNDAKLHTFNAPAQGGIGIAAAGRVDGLFLDFKLHTAN
ncbi:MAG: hypothetical protein AAGI68_05310 [Planctomycetota bacterium]